jgi:RimJ/RimL family protein N-acetyltransferase
MSVGDGPRVNSLGQPIGAAVPDWRAPPPPPRQSQPGRLCVVEPLDPSRHAESLFEAVALDGEGRMWTYLGYGPFPSPGAYRDWLDAQSRSADPLFFAVVDRATSRAVGVASYLRINPRDGVAEIGHLAFSPLLQRRATATEAIYLMIRNLFDLGYRRCEWKCDALNGASRAAAERLGFTFEGIFRQALLYKGRNRDTAWYSIIDTDWPALDVCLRCWLDPANFNEHGRQRMSLSTMTAGLNRSWRVPPAGRGG